MKDIIKLLLVLGLLLRAGQASAAREDAGNLEESRSSSFSTSLTVILPNGKSLEEWKTAIQKIEQIVADRRGYNETLLAFMKRTDLSPETRVNTYRGVVGGSPEGDNPLDIAIRATEDDLKIYDEIHDQFMRRIKVYTSLVESGRSITSFKIVEILDELYAGLYERYLIEENARKKFIELYKASKTVNIHTMLKSISNRNRAGELVYLKEILHALVPFVDQVTIDIHAKYYKQTAKENGTIIKSYKIEPEILVRIFDRKNELQGKMIKLGIPSEHPFDLDVTIKSIKENLDNAVSIHQEIFATKEKITKESGAIERQKLIKNIKEFEKCFTTAENLIGMLEKHTVKTSKKQKDDNTAGAAAAASAAGTNQGDASDHSVRQTDSQSSFAAASSSSSSSSSTHTAVSSEDEKNSDEEQEKGVSSSSSSSSSSASSFGTEMTEKEKRRYDQAIEQHIYGKKREPKSGADLGKLIEEVKEFRTIAEDNQTKQRVRYEEMLTLVRRMGGDVFPFGKKGGSHRRIEIPHINNGKIITCGTYEPHGGEGYPLWLDFAMNAIDRATT